MPTDHNVIISRCQFDTYSGVWAAAVSDLAMSSSKADCSFAPEPGPKHCQPVGGPNASVAQTARNSGWTQNASGGSTVAIKSDDGPACPVVAGVVDADKCGGGYHATDSTTALQTALNAPGAHTVIISNGSRPTPWVTGPVSCLHPCASPSTYPGRTEAMLLVKRLLWVRFLTNYVPVQLKIQACTSRDCHPQQVILNALFLYRKFFCIENVFSPVL